MTKQEAIEMLMDMADGDTSVALELAVDWVAKKGMEISAGFRWNCPYDHINPPKPKPAPLDA